MLHKRTYKVVESIKYGETVFLLEKTRDGVSEIDDWFSYDTREGAEKEAEKQNACYYLSDYDNSEIEEFFNGIDFKPLFDALDELLGFKLTYNISLVKDHRSQLYNSFEIESDEDLVDAPGLLGKFIRTAWKSMKVATFSRSIYVDKETGELAIWGTIDYKYVHQDGGSNGAEILSFRYSNSEGWRIEANIDRQLYYDIQEEKRDRMYKEN